MAENKKSVLLYCDIIYTVEELDDADAGLLFKHYLRYINDQNPEPPSKLIKIVFEPIKQNLKRDLIKWEQKSLKNSESAHIRWNKGNTNASERIERNAKHADKDTVKDTVKGNVTVKESIAPARDFEWFKSQIDEIWTDQLPTEKKKNLGAAIQNAWQYLSANKLELKAADSARCKRLVNNAFQFLKTDTNGTIRRNQTIPQSTQSFSGDYTGNGGPVLRSDIDL
jgi:hypothetical protein